VSTAQKRSSDTAEEVQAVIPPHTNSKPAEMLPEAKTTTPLAAASGTVEATLDSENGTVDVIGNSRDLDER
jgi:hypothetical protein